MSIPPPSLIDVVVGKYYQVKYKIGSGSFGEIYLGLDIRTSEKCAVKVECKDTKYPQLLEEFKVYRALKPAAGLPAVYWCGTALGAYNVMVMELLGDSLETLYNKCLTDDMEVLTDRGFMSRAAVFAACPELAASSAPATLQVEQALPFGGAVRSAPTLPTDLMYWTPSAAEVAADVAAGIQHQRLRRCRGFVAVVLCDRARRYGRQCGGCSARVWGSTKGSAHSLLVQHVHYSHSELVLLARRASPSTASTSSSTARPLLTRPASLPVGSRTSVDEKEQEALRHATLHQGGGAVRRGSLQLKNPSAMSDVSVEQPPAPSTTSSGVAETGTRSSDSASSHSARSICSAVLPVSRVGQSISSLSSVVSSSSVVASPPASRQRVTSESPASFTRSLLSASAESGSEPGSDVRPNAPYSCEYCGSYELDWMDDAALWHCQCCWEFASEDWVAKSQDEEEVEEEKDVPLVDQMDEEQTDADRPSSAAQQSAHLPPLLFASLDPETGHLVYLPATALTVNTVTSLVEFTQAANAPSWADDADEYGLTPDEAARMKARSDRARDGEKLDHADKFHAEHTSNGLSLVVDPQHDMFVRVGRGGHYATTAGTQWQSDKYRKVKAGSLLSDDHRLRVKMTGQAEAGLATYADELPFAAVLGLTREAEVTAFLELYGYWLGDGFLNATGQATGM